MLKITLDEIRAIIKRVLIEEIEDGAGERPTIPAKLSKKEQEFSQDVGSWTKIGHKKLNDNPVQKKTTAVLAAIRDDDRWVNAEPVKRKEILAAAETLLKSMDPADMMVKSTQEIVDELIH